MKLQTFLSIRNRRDVPRELLLSINPFLSVCHFYFPLSKVTLKGDHVDSIKTIILFHAKLALLLFDNRFANRFKYCGTLLMSGVNFEAGLSQYRVLLLKSSFKKKLKFWSQVTKYCLAGLMGQLSEISVQSKEIDVSFGQIILYIN